MFYSNSNLKVYCGYLYIKVIDTEFGRYCEYFFKNWDEYVKMREFKIKELVLFMSNQ